MTAVAFCPNCGKRFYYPDLIAGVQADPGKSGCGDCAQACVRPRELYRLRITDTDWDSGEEPLREALTRIGNCPNPDSVEDCHNQMSDIARHALGRTTP